MTDGKRECPYCGKEYKGWKKHIKGQHPNEPWPPVTFGNTQPCEVCGKKPTRLVYEEDEVKYLCEEHSDSVEITYGD